MKSTINRTNPILILEQIPGSNVSEEPNAYGYETIRIWQFDYDGKGTALVSYDDDAELDLCFDVDLEHILFGNPHTGHRWYRSTNLNITGPPTVETPWNTAS